MSGSCAVHRIIWLFSGLVLPVPNHFEWNREGSTPRQADRVRKVDFGGALFSLMTSPSCNRPSADQPTACAVDDHLSRSRGARSCFRPYWYYGRPGFPGALSSAEFRPICRQPLTLR